MSTSAPAATSQVPDEAGRFGEFGRRFVPETLMHALEELTVEYEKAKTDPEFQAELHTLLTTFVGRPNPLYFAERLTEICVADRAFCRLGLRRAGRAAPDREPTQNQHLNSTIFAFKIASKF